MSKRIILPQENTFLDLGCELIQKICNDGNKPEINTNFVNNITSDNFVPRTVNQNWPALVKNI